MVYTNIEAKVLKEPQKEEGRFERDNMSPGTFFSLAPFFFFVTSDPNPISVLLCY